MEPAAARSAFDYHPVAQAVSLALRASGVERHAAAMGWAAWVEDIFPLHSSALQGGLLRLRPDASETAKAALLEAVRAVFAGEGLEKAVYPFSLSIGQDTREAIYINYHDLRYLGLAKLWQLRDSLATPHLRAVEDTSNDAEERGRE